MPCPTLTCSVESVPQITKGVDEAEITAVYIAGVKASLEPSAAATLSARISQNRAGFAVNRTAFGSPLAQYHASARNIACRSLRHSRTSRLSPRLGELLGLAPNEARIHRGHPLHGEYQVPADHRFRFFPAAGKVEKRLCDLQKALNPFSPW